MLGISSIKENKPSNVERLAVAGIMKLDCDENSSDFGGGGDLLHSGRLSLMFKTTDIAMTVPMLENQSPEIENNLAQVT